MHLRIETINFPEKTTSKLSLHQMNIAQVHEARMLRTLSSMEAANWIMRTYDFVPATLNHRSWKREDQIRLLEIYFPQSFVSGGEYSLRQFLSFMSVKLFWHTIKDDLDKLSAEELGLFTYYFPRVIRDQLRSEREVQLGEDIVETLNALLPKNSPYKIIRPIN